MKIQIFVIGLGIMLVLGSGLISTTGAAPGDSFEDPKTAVLGDNSGTINLENGRFYFRFTPSADSTYKFSLYGPENTDFELEIRVEGTGDNIGSAYGSSYPDVVIVSDITQTVIIEVIGYSDTGDFILNIEPSSQISEISYSSELQQGDTFTWDILFERNEEPVTDLDYDFGFTDGDVLELELLQDGGQISFGFNDYDVYNDLQSSFRVSQNDNSSDEFFFYVTLLIQPTTYSFEDGTNIGLLEAQEEGIAVEFFGGDYVLEGDEFVSIETTTDEYYEGETVSFEHRIDASTGLLNLIDWTSDNGTVVDHIIWQRRGIGLNRINTGAGGLLEDLPLSPLWAILGLGLMVVYQRKRK